MSYVKPADRRMKSWDRKFNAESVASIVEKGKSDWLANVHKQFSELVHAELSAKQFLNEQKGVCGRIAQYLCFAREVWKITNYLAGEAARDEVRARVAKWLVRGLDADVMWNMARKVFNIGRPEE